MRIWFRKLTTLTPFLLIFLITTIVFRRYFIHGLLPIPYNIMVGWYFPFNQGGWPDYSPGIIYKGGLFAADVFRQMIPWKMLSLDLIKSGQLPLWNPYNFSGEPLLANIQSTIFYPLSLLFFIIPDFHSAWAWYIILCPFLGSIFAYLFLRTLKLSSMASLVGALAFGFSGRMLSWLEWGVVTHAIIWLPLILMSLHRFFITSQTKHLFILIFASIATILGGYPQESAYSLLVAAGFAIYLHRFYPAPYISKRTLRLFISVLLILVFVAPQLIPTWRLYTHSALQTSASTQLFLRARLSVRQLVTVLAPDFYGNRITNNYYGDTISGTDYMDSNLFIGTSAFIFFLLSLSVSNQRFLRHQPHTLNYQPFFRLMLILSLFLAVKSPLTELLGTIRLPTLTTSSAAGITTISVFCLSMLAAYGYDKLPLIQNLRPIATIASIYTLLPLWILTVPDQYKIVAFRNSLLSLAVALLTLTLICLYRFSVRLPPLSRRASQLLRRPIFLNLPLIILILIELTFYSTKLLSFSPPSYAYPPHILYTRLQQLSSVTYGRSIGFWENQLATNLDTAYRVYSILGYNPLHTLAYQQLFSASDTGSYHPDSLQRSDALCTQSNESNRNRLMDLTSVEFVAARITDSNQEWETEPLKYDPDRFELIWQEQGFKIYRNRLSLPRVSIYNTYQVVPDPVERIRLLFDPGWEPRSSLILNSPPHLRISPSATGSATIISYQPNRVEIKADISIGPAILLFTDSYYPSWKALINTEQTKIYKANHAFRAVLLPEGNHHLTFKISWP